jgi:phosphoglycolate phosphatase-like HAD superfamily hydrolase
MSSYLLLPFVGAGAGWAAAAWLPLALHYRNLDRIVRGQLAAGRWVLLVRNVPWAQQRDVLELLRDRGVGWCVVSGSRRRDLRGRRVTPDHGRRPG